MNTRAENPTAWTTEPVYDERGQRICALDGCRKRHAGKGLCRLHYRRFKTTGDPLRKSRFATPEEKDAFVAADIAARRKRREREREKYEAEQERLRLLRPRTVNRIRPEATALVNALDALDEAERASVASMVVSILLGRPVEGLTPAPTTTRTKPTTEESPA